MNKKFKRAGATLALLLVGAAGAAGSLAYLQQTTGPVTNTFTATSGLIDTDAIFALKETTPTPQPNGDYVITTTNRTETHAEYANIVPGVTLGKDPAVMLNDLNVQSYLFIKETETPNSALKYSVNTNNWKKIGTSKVWYYVGEGATETGVLSTIDTAKGEKEITAEILTDQQVTVDDFDHETLANGNLGKLKYEAYLVQASGFDDAMDAWSQTYGKN